MNYIASVFFCIKPRLGFGFDAIVAYYYACRHNNIQYRYYFIRKVGSKR